jgi:hypothetical protein
MRPTRRSLRSMRAPDRYIASPASKNMESLLQRHSHLSPVPARRTKSPATRARSKSPAARARAGGAARQTPPVAETPPVADTPSPGVPQLAASFKGLLGVSEVPEHMASNQFLLTGYRHETPSYRICLGSLFTLHNDTHNAWTALLLVVINISIGVFGASTLIKQGAPAGVIAWVIIHGVIRTFCWVASVGMHLLSSFSEEVSFLWNTLDFLGIYIR